MSQLHRAIMAASVFVGALFALPAQAVLLGPYGGTWDGTESTIATRLLRNNDPSSCASPKTYPGTFGGTNYFETFSFLNTGQDTECVTVSPNQNTQSFMSVYLGSFNPTNLATNYHGDQGASNSDPWSFEVPSGAEFLIMVSTVNGTASIGSFYSFQLRGDNLEEGEGTNPIPEPATLALLGLGLAGLAYGRRKQS